MIKSIRGLDLGSNRYQVYAEIYNSISEMFVDLDERIITDSRFHDVRHDGLEDPKWYGVETYDEALTLLTKGYSPAVTRIYDEIKTKSGRRINGTNKGRILTTSVEGFQPIVPLVLKGIPNNMLVKNIEKKEARVINLFIDTTVVSSTTIEELIRCGIQLVKYVYMLEMAGHKINLYVSFTSAGQASADMLCVKIKNSNNPIDLRRISFPLCHTAFLRVICFDWYSKFSEGVFRKNYGSPLTNMIGEQAAGRLYKRLFGPSSVLLSTECLKTGGEAYLKKELEIDDIRINKGVV